MAYIRTCVQNLGEIRRPVRNNCPSSLIIDMYHAKKYCAINIYRILFSVGCNFVDFRVYISISEVPNMTI